MCFTSLVDEVRLYTAGWNLQDVGGGVITSPRWITPTCTCTIEKVL